MSGHCSVVVVIPVPGYADLGAKVLVQQGDLAPDVGII
jgi:hypothetical protein